MAVVLGLISCQVELLLGELQKQHSSKINKLFRSKRKILSIENSMYLYDSRHLRADRVASIAHQVLDIEATNARQVDIHPDSSFEFLITEIFEYFLSSAVEFSLSPNPHNLRKKVKSLIRTLFELIFELRDFCTTTKSKIITNPLWSP